jgi:hypothetical protein
LAKTGNFFSTALDIFQVGIVAKKFQCMKQEWQVLRQAAVYITFHDPLPLDLLYRNSAFKDPPIEWLYFITHISDGLETLGETRVIYPIDRVEPTYLEFAYKEENFDNFEAEVEIRDCQYIVTTEKYLLLNRGRDTEHYMEYTGARKGKKLSLFF